LKTVTKVSPLREDACLIFDLFEIIDDTNATEGIEHATPALANCLTIKFLIHNP
jgi:hypothetical protein